MLFVPKKLNKSLKFQQGGAMPAESVEEAPVEGAPVEEAPAEGQDPLMMLAEGAAQALQTQDCQIAMQVCQGLVALVQLAAPQEPQGEPVFARKGGKLIRRIKK